MKNKIGMIIAFILGAIIFSGIGAYAAIKFQANEIGYNTTSVADALDSLYQTQFSDNYSTDERVVGKWVDGKPVYQKVIATDISLIWNGTYFAYANVGKLVDNVDTITNSYFVGVGISGDLTISHYNTDTWEVVTSERSGNIKYIIIQYTKTTDQPIGN